MYICCWWSLYTCISYCSYWPEKISTHAKESDDRSRRRSKLRIPSRPVRRLKRLLAPVPEKGTQLEPLLAAAGRVDGALVAKVDVLADGQALRVLVRQDGGPAGLWLSNDVGRPGVVQEAVVDAARVPRVDAACAAERGVAYQGVPASVVVACVVVCAEVVLLGCCVRTAV